MAKKTFLAGFDLKKILMIAAVLVVVWVVFTSLKTEGFGLKEGAANAAQSMQETINKITSGMSTNKKSKSN